MIFRRRPEGPPRLGRALVLRAGLTAILVIGLTATAVATSVILEVTRVKDILTEHGRQAIKIPEVTEAQAGGPRTILVLGSDQRYQDKQLGLKPRSDTILLIRANPRTGGITVLSVPRDLRVEIPGHGEDKVNAAFEDGGPRLTVRTIQRLFRSVTGKRFPINNVIVVNFGSFKAAVNYVHGVYVDVDRRYFNDNSDPNVPHYATINIPAGYQKLTGQDALNYVRYRHTDSDLIRAARQQDFLRQVRNSAGFRRLLSIGNGAKLARIFSKYFQFDTGFTKTQEIFSLLKLGVFLAERHPDVQQIPFPVYEAPNPMVNTFLYYHSAAVKSAITTFMAAKGHSQGTPSKHSGGHHARRAKLKLSAIAGLNDARTMGEDQAVLAQPKAHFPVYFPTLRYNASTYVPPPRTYTIRDEIGKRHRAYRLVLSTGLVGEYYGIQGMTWKSPPILDDPDQTRRVAGRRLQIYLDGKHVRLVAWRTRRAVYWVSNTLTETLDRAQMLGIAASLHRLKG